MSGRSPSGRATHEPGLASRPGHSVGVPNAALDSWWPIPINTDNEGLFCDLASEGAATGLLALMTGISEETWCASWMTGIEWDLWRAREHGPNGTVATKRQADLLRLLSEEAEGWWYFVDGVGPRFTRLDKWRAHAQGIEAQRATTAKQGVVHESPVANGDAPKGQRHDHQ